MPFLGEIISLFVAFAWTMSALFFDYAGNRIGSLVVNLLRLLFAAVMLGVMLFFTTGSPIAAEAGYDTWFWMSISGFVGFVFGDLCLFYSYTLITARFSQLIMTLAPPFAALFGWVTMGEQLSAMGYIGMSVTLFGIAISILTRRNGDSGKFTIKLPVKGVLYAIGGALGQGLGIVLSKIGMEYYTADITDQNIAPYIPFAATQIRVVTGIIGFILIIIISGRSKKFMRAFNDLKAVAATGGGAVFGPFIGVSLSLMAVRYTNTAIASTIMATTPIIILLPYKFIYKKHITGTEILGAVISVIGVSLFFI